MCLCVQVIVLYPLGIVWMAPKQQVSPGQIRALAPLVLEIKYSTCDFSFYICSLLNDAETSLKIYKKYLLKQGQVITFSMLNCSFLDYTSINLSLEN